MDEYAHLDKLFEVLSRDSLWSKTEKELDSIRANEPDGGWLNGEVYRDASLWNRINFDNYRTFAYGGLGNFFETHVLSHLDLPVPITAYELNQLALEQLSGASSTDEVRDARVRLLSRIGILTFYNCEDTNLSKNDFKIGQWSSPPQADSLANGRLHEEVWTSESGFQLYVDYEDGPFSESRCTLWGKVSDGAMESATKSMSRLVPSAARTVKIVKGTGEFDRYFDSVPISDLVWGDGNKLFRACLSRYYQRPTKKTSTLEQRMRNAVHLLVEADSQESSAIGLSLCFSAIEALVCEKMEGIVDELSRHVAALLQPDAMKRPDAIAAIKRLYNQRSKALHGAIFSENKDAWRSARRLAAAVLKAVVDWQTHVAKVGTQPTRSDFLSELRPIVATGQQMVGISSELFEFLPDNAA